MRYIIYKITNQINGKIYIGKHQTEKLDDDYFGSGTYLNRAIKKYGIENFTFHLEFELQTEEEMNLLEKFVVNMEFLKRNDVYNLREGGEGGHLTEQIIQKISAANKGKKYHLGKHHNEETKKKMNAAKKGKHRTDETKKRISTSNKGKPKSEIHKLHISQCKKGKPLSEIAKLHMSESRIKFPVVQYTLDLKFVAEYVSTKDAERKTGINRGNISNCCKGKYQTTGGFRWFYKEDLVYFF